MVEASKSMVEESTMLHNGVKAALAEENNLAISMADLVCVQSYLFTLSTCLDHAESLAEEDRSIEKVFTNLHSGAASSHGR